LVVLLEASAEESAVELDELFGGGLVSFVLFVS